MGVRSRWKEVALILASILIGQGLDSVLRSPIIGGVLPTLVEVEQKTTMVPLLAPYEVQGTALCSPDTWGGGGEEVRRREIRENDQLPLGISTEPPEIRRFQADRIVA